MLCTCVLVFLLLLPFLTSKFFRMCSSVQNETLVGNFQILPVYTKILEDGILQMETYICVYIPLRE